MRATLRERANQLFARHPRLGWWGYRLLRTAGLDNSTRNVKPFMRRLAARGFVPSAIVDVGANHGGWSDTVRSVFPGARFLLIEPQSEMAPFLTQFCARAPGSEWVQAGAGAEAGEQLLTVWDDLQGSAILPDAIHALTPYGERRAIPIVTVNELVTSGRFPVPDLIKIDVQGYEMDVLQGATTVLGQTEAFIVETSLYDPLGGRPTFYRVAEFMETAGYAIFDFAELRYRSGDQALAQLDVCFVRANGILRTASVVDRRRAATSRV